MIRYTSSALACFAFSLASTGFAQAGGLALGARVGYALPMGKAGAPATGATTNTANDDLSDIMSGMIPVAFDIGYRINDTLYVGGFLQFGFVSINKDNAGQAGCKQGLSCSAHDIAFGGDIQYHILPDAPFDPWIGAGLGYEILTENVTGNLNGTSVDATVSFKGFQFLNLLAGADFKPAPNLAMGPFLGLTLGQYGSYSISRNANGMTTDQSGDLTDTGVHEWLTIGVRGQFNL